MAFYLHERHKYTINRYKFFKLPQIHRGHNAAKLQTKKNHLFRSL